VGRSTILLIAASALACGHSDDSSPSGNTGVPTRVEPAEQLSQIVATCADLHGTSEVRRKGSVRWEKIALGATLREGDWVRTAGGSHARLRFAGGFLDLGEDTAVIVDKAIAIEHGAVTGTAEGKDGFVVQAGDGSRATIAGTQTPVEFRLTPTPQHGLEVAVIKGAAQLVTQGGSRALAAGEASDVANERAGEVVKLIAFPKSLSPGVDARFLFAAETPIPLTWSSVPGAARYHLQVARDTEFHALVRTSDASAPNGSFVPDAEGVYLWRVAARGANGRLGEYGFARRIYCEKDEPHDLLVAPSDGQQIGFSGDPPRVVFSWRPRGDAKDYKLVVERVRDGEAVVNAAIAGQQRQVVLDEGIYRWGVYAVHAGGEQPIFLKQRQLAIRKQPGPDLDVRSKWR
jgi:hypothetical protein